jgi:hypothetical protein
MAQVVKYLPSKCEALNSIPPIEKKKKKTTKVVSCPYFLFFTQLYFFIVLFVFDKVSGWPQTFCVPAWDSRSF